MTWLLGVPLAVFLVCWWLTGQVSGWLERRAILDRPVERSSHRAPVPRGGGLALVPVLVITWIGLVLAGRAPASGAAIAALAGALALLSWLDDLRGLPIALRFGAHLAAAVLGLAFLPGAGAVFQGLLPPLLDRAATVLLWVWFVELFNFMDGIDGIAGIETVALGAGVALVALAGGQDGGRIAALGLSAAAAGLAFLRWNWHPARIFLGDIGSVALGYLLAWLLLALAASGFWAPAFILPLYYLADATLTLAGRVLRRERFWQPHRQHFYQRALNPDGNHAAVTRLVLAGDLLLMLAALVAVERPILGLAAGALVVLVLLAALELRARRPAPTAAS